MVSIGSDNGLVLPGSCFSIETICPGIGIPIIKIRRSWDGLIYIMGIFIPVSQCLYIEVAPRCQATTWTNVDQNLKCNIISRFALDVFKMASWNMNPWDKQKHNYWRHDIFFIPSNQICMKNTDFCINGIWVSPKLLEITRKKNRLNTITWLTKK